MLAVITLTPYPYPPPADKNTKKQVYCSCLASGFHAHADAAFTQVIIRNPLRLPSVARNHEISEKWRHGTVYILWTKRERNGMRIYMCSSYTMYITAQTVQPRETIPREFAGISLCNEKPNPKCGTNTEVLPVTRCCGSRFVGSALHRMNPHVDYCMYAVRTCIQLTLVSIFSSSLFCTLWHLIPVAYLLSY